MHEQYSQQDNTLQIKHKAEPNGKRGGREGAGKKDNACVRKHIHMHTEGHHLMKLLSFCSVDCKATWMEASDRSKVVERSKGKILHWDKHALNYKLNERLWRPRTRLSATSCVTRKRPCKRRVLRTLDRILLTFQHIQVRNDCADSRFTPV